MKATELYFSSVLLSKVYLVVTIEPVDEIPKCEQLVNLQRFSVLQNAV